MAQTEVFPGVVDLRVEDLPTPTPAPTVTPDPHPWPTPATGVTSAADRAQLRRRRLIALAVVLAIVGLWAADFIVGRVVHDQHQRHLAAAIQTSKLHTDVGDPVMILQIPSIQLDQVVAFGTDAAVLRGGPGLVTPSALPGRRGTAVVLGHRDRYGSPFGRLGDVHRGDTAAVKARTGVITTYTVTKVARVSAAQPPPITSSKAGRMVLVTTNGGVWPDQLIEVTFIADQPPTIGRPPRGPVRLAVQPSSASGLLVLILLVGAVVSTVLGAVHLRRRYRPGAVATALIPLTGLVILVAVLALDLALSSVY